MMKKNNRAEEHYSKRADDLLKKAGTAMQVRVDNRMLLAAKIDDAVKAKGWNQSRFAKEMGKTPSEISKWLSGTHNFTTETLWDIEEKLGIQVIVVDENDSNVTKVAVYMAVVVGHFKGHVVAGFKDRTYIGTPVDDKTQKTARVKRGHYA